MGGSIVSKRGFKGKNMQIFIKIEIQANLKFNHCGFHLNQDNFNLISP